MTLALWAVAAAQQVDVHLSESGGFDWTDLITPAGTLLGALAGGIGGVFIGSRMNRRTLNTLEDQRLKREDAREMARATTQEGFDVARSVRERELEDLRHEHTVGGERRQALGALRVVMAALRRAQTRFEFEADPPQGTLLGSSIDTELHLRDEELRAIAVWVPDHIWTKLSITIQATELLNVYRSGLRSSSASATLTTEDYRTKAATGAELLRSVLDDLAAFSDQMSEAVPASS